jgi:hypothetical protein
MTDKRRGAISSTWIWNIGSSYQSTRLRMKTNSFWEDDVFLWVVVSDDKPATQARLEDVRGRQVKRAVETA